MQLDPSATLSLISDLYSQLGAQADHSQQLESALIERDQELRDSSGEVSTLTAENAQLQQENTALRAQLEDKTARPNPPHGMPQWDGEPKGQ